MKLSSFQKSVAVLFGGTALSQLITISALPILTRIYTPEDFSLLSVYAATLGILLTIACLRFEIAIPIPEHEGEAARLLILSIISTTILSALTIVAILIIPGSAINTTTNSQLSEYLWLIPAGVLMGGSYNAMQFWATRQKKFGLIAQTKLLQSITGTAIQILIGLLTASPLGLLLGYLINIAAGALGLGRKIIKEKKQAKNEISLKKIKLTFSKYQSFPKHSTTEALLNTAGIQLPIIIIAATMNSPEAGFLMLALRAMQVPMSLLGSAIAQAYLSQAPEMHRNGELDKLTNQVLSSLFKLGVGPLFFIGITGTELFAVIFGEEWGPAGALVGWMTPWFILQFISSPISMVMHVTGNHRDMLALTTTGFILRVGLVITSTKYASNFTSEVYAISGGIFYLICFMVFTKNANITKRAILALISNNLAIIIAWVSIGFIAELILERLNG